MSYILCIIILYSQQLSYGQFCVDGDCSGFGFLEVD